MGTVFLHGNGGGGSGGGTLTVISPAGVTVTVSNNDKTYTKTAGADGVAVFKGLTNGTWTITISKDGSSSSRTVNIVTDYDVLLAFEMIPEFTYTGDYKIVNDSDVAITTSKDNWKIRFLTSGILKFSDLNGAYNGIDVFCIGGGGGGGNGIHGTAGGGGGGGGRGATAKGISVTVGKEYAITVGGGSSSTGGATSAFELTAKGGNASSGGTGGSGGNNGGNGGNTSSNNANAGGSGSISTREFGEKSGTYYAGGGGGGGHGYGSAGAGGKGGGGAGGYYNGNNHGIAGVTNTGGGGGGGMEYCGEGRGAAGGSGIVIIRNARG